MPSVTSATSGVTDLLRIFSGNSPSPVSSALSSSSVQAALQKASPVDIVQLSEQALQLQQVTGFFGGSGGSGSGEGSQAPTDAGSALLQTLAGLAAGSQAGQSGTGSASVSAIASYLSGSGLSGSGFSSSGSGSGSGTISLLG